MGSGLSFLSLGFEERDSQLRYLRMVSADMLVKWRNICKIFYEDTIEYLLDNGNFSPLFVYYIQLAARRSFSQVCRKAPILKLFRNYLLLLSIE